ncbi:hypothetical protein [Planomonospora venezuelensis]|uniref:Uncharacterized protein n=1 Tax=Planomonospora venezuelensis TaxID=1999 RepID=A0A841D4L2_PLAVE|nr:hypothetical protein [Planomonospora venezuelensis]MBB5963318.1 hypothetical protein [Planomonospora venezuelensis]GIN02723.1 hypothetical protein Pve01_43810 [Planomonospora venezuelensis]
MNGGETPGGGRAGDDAIEDVLRHAAGIIDPVPAHLLQAAVEAYALASIEAELAELVFDSLTQSAPVRGTDRPRLLTFRGNGLTLDLEITAGRLVGQLLPPQPAEIELLGGRSPAAALTADAAGRFVCDRVAAGPFSLHCRAGGAVITTEWLTV